MSRISLFKIGSLTGVLFIISFVLSFSALGQKKNEALQYAPFNKKYNSSQKGEILSWWDTEKALSAVTFHKGLLLTPLSYDLGGGQGDGAFAAYNVDDPYKPFPVFDSRDYPEKYHNPESKDYLGDVAEMHAMHFYGDLLMLTERGFDKHGFMILDLGPLYDNDEKTFPEIISRFYFPDVQQSTIYDGFSFAPLWAGGQYVYAPTGANGLYIIDTKNIKEPKLICHLRKDQLYNQTVRSANAIGDLLILSPAAIASQTSEIVFLDISNPETPSLLNRHKIKIGYHGTVYGSRFYNGAYINSHKNKKAKVSEVLAYDFLDVANIKEVKLGTTERLFNPEYIYVQDDDLFIGNYTGLCKFKVKDDKISFDTTIEPQFPKSNDYGFISPLGNLTVVTSDHIGKSRINIGVQQTEPDLRGPELKYILPKNGQKNVALTCKIGISFSDFIDATCLEEGAVYVKEKGSDKKIPCNFGHGIGIVHAIPEKALKENTTYEVYLTNKLRDLVRNPYEGEHLVSSFSTGAELNDFSCEIIAYKPTPIGKEITLEAKISNLELKDNLAYSWSFGDGTPDTEFSKKSKISKLYNKPGNYNVILKVKDKKSGQLSTSSTIQVVHSDFSKNVPESSSTLYFEKISKHLFVANPDNNTVTAIDTETGAILFEKNTAKNPVSLLYENDRLWVSCAKADQINILSAKTGALLKTISTGYGSAPHGITIDRNEQKCYVVLSNIGKVQEIDINTYKLNRTIEVKGTLRNIAFAPRKHTLIVPQFIATEQLGSYVQLVNTKDWKITYQKRLAPSLNTDGSNNGRGYPNYMGTIAVNPEQNNFWIPGKKDNLFRGLRRDGEPLDFDHTVRSIAVSMDLDNPKENFEDRVDLDNNDFATAATYSPYGNIVYIATLGSQTIWAIDAYDSSNQSVFNSYGEGVTAMTTDDEGTKLYVHNQLSREITVFDSAPYGKLKFNTKWKLVSHELLAENVLIGKRIFNNTTRNSMSQEGYMSCTSCHMDGSHDGRIWDISNLGEGLRNTIDLRGKSGMGHGMLHWTGNFDEVQDFNNQITALNKGTGFLFDELSLSHPQLQEDKFGGHRELDQLADYVSSLSEFPKSPYKNDKGEHTKKALLGCKHFINLKCYTCHAGDQFTDSKTRALHDVGTYKETSGNRLGKTFLGIDTPTLINLWNTAPYLHDGSAKTLSDVFNAGQGVHAESHQRVNTLSSKKKKELMLYLKQLDTEEGGVIPKDVCEKNNKPKFDKEVYTFDYIYKYDKREQIIGKVFAQDTDENQKTTYTLEPNGASALYSIDSISGELNFVFNHLYLRHKYEYFKEYKQQYWFKVRAEDNGDFKQNSSAKVIVNVVYPTMGVHKKEIGVDKKEVAEIIKLNKILDAKKELTPKQKNRYIEINKKIKSMR